MSQQGDAREDDWWDQLYEESAPDTGPDRAADTLDDRFASAIHTVEPPREPVTRDDSPPPWDPGPTPPSPHAFASAPPEPAAPWPATERLGRPYVPGARPLPGDAEADGQLPADAPDHPPLPRRPLPPEPEGNGPLPRRPPAPETTDSPPLPQRPPRREPARPDGFTGWFGTSPERSAGEAPPPPLPAEWTGATPRRRKGNPVEGTGTSDAVPATPKDPRGGPSAAATKHRDEPAGAPARDEPGASGGARGGPDGPVRNEAEPAAEGTGPGRPPERDEPEGFGPVRGEFARGTSNASTPPRHEPEPVGDRSAPPEPVRSESAPPEPVPDESAPPAPRLPRHALPPSSPLPPSPPQRAQAERAPAGRGTPDRPPSPPGEADGPAAWQGAPPRTDREATTPAPPPPPPPGPAPGAPAWPGTGAGPAAPPAPVPPSPRAERPPALPGASAWPGTGETSPQTPAAPRAPYVGDRPPTYEAEPTALAESDPGALDAYVPDTVLEGGRFGGSTVRAVSQRGDSARYRGEARRDALLLVRFGAGDEGIVLVATATGARACPEAHRAATEAVRSIAAAVGRSHRRLADDIRAARRGDLKSGLHRLTDRTLGRLRAAAAERGLAPEEYTASLRCLLLPTDGQCRTRVFFGAGDGGLFRLRGGELRDIEPEVPADGQPRSGPEAGALTLDSGIGRPPSPYAPAEEPRREPFRFHASIARSGDVLLLCGTGLAEPLRGSPPLASRLAEEWSVPEPPGLAAFLATSQTRVKGYADDRTLAAVWER